MNKARAGYFFALASGVFYAINAVVVKIGNTSIFINPDDVVKNNMFFAAGYFAAGTIAVIIWLIATGKKKDLSAVFSLKFSPSKKGVALMAFYAFFSGPVASTLMGIALKHADPTVVSAILLTNPPLTMFLSYIFLKDKVSASFILGLVMIIAGVMATLIGQQAFATQTSILGIACAMGVSLSWAFQGIILSWSMVSISPQSAILVRNTCAMLIFFVMIAFAGYFADFISFLSNRYVLYAMVATGLLRTTSSFFQYAATDRILPGRANSIYQTWSLWLVLFSVLLKLSNADIKIIAAVAAGSIGVYLLGIDIKKGKTKSIIRVESE